MKRVPLIGVVSLALLLTGSSAAVATEPAPVRALTQPEEEQLRTFFTQYDVPEETQDDLIAEFEDGRAWDSMSNGEVVDEEVELSPTSSQKITTYADGSIKVGTVDQPLPEGYVGVQSVADCRVASSTAQTVSYVGCRVTESIGAISSVFASAYTYYRTGGGRIDSMGTPEIAVLGGVASNIRWGVNKPVADNTGYATARVDFDVTASSDLAFFNCWSEFRLSQTGVTSSGSNFGSVSI